MIKRPTPLDIPDRYPYMVVELPDRESHHMRIPSHLTVAKMIKSLDQVHIAALMAMKGGVSAASAVHLVKETGPELAAVMGALIGQAWNHRDWQLQTEPAPDLMAYGEAVWEELHNDGYHLETLLLLSLTVVRAIWDQSQFSAEVSKRAAFFYPLMGNPNLSGSISGSSTSETPLDSNN